MFWRADEGTRSSWRFLFLQGRCIMTAGKAWPSELRTPLRRESHEGGDVVVRHDERQRDEPGSALSLAQLRHPLCGSHGQGHSPIALDRNM
jgi:hypothetical protein